MQHVGCCDPAVADDNIDVTVTVVGVADDGYITVRVNRYDSFCHTVQDVPKTDINSVLTLCP